jgi:glycosyltransferase involved in cell wall biosynthesis
VNSLETGGAEMLLASLVARTDRSRFDPVVVALCPETAAGPVRERILAAGVRIHDLGIRRGLPDPRAIIRLAAVLRRERPAVVQSWLYHSDAFALFASALAGRPPLVWSLWCSDMDMSKYSLGSRILPTVLARLSAWPAAVVTNSEAGRRAHAAIGYRPRRWEVIPSGFDTGAFRPDDRARVALRAELGVEPGAELVGMVARWDPMKDHRTFLEAAALVRAVRPDVHFVLVGRGVDAANGELAGRIEALGLGDRVHLLGSRPNVVGVMAAFDVGCLSSRTEGLPGVVAEMMACAVPCVATDVGDTRHLVADTGAVVPPNDPQALAAALSEMLARGAGRRADLGAAARDRILSAFHQDGFVSRFEALYASLIGRAA